MRTLSLILVLPAFLLTAGYVLGSPQEGEKIEQEQGPYFWDFGRVPEGEVLEHTFVLKNDSPVTLRIERIHTSCGCTSSDVERKEIPAGEGVDIQAKFNTSGYSGVKKQFVYVHTDRQDNPVIKLTLRADIQTKGNRQ